MTIMHPRQISQLALLQVFRLQVRVRQFMASQPVVVTMGSSPPRPFHFQQRRQGSDLKTAAVVLRRIPYIRRLPAVQAQSMLQSAVLLMVGRVLILQFRQELLQAPSVTMMAQIAQM